MIGRRLAWIIFLGFTIANGCSPRLKCNVESKTIDSKLLDGLSKVIDETHAAMDLPLRKSPTKGGFGLSADRIHFGFAREGPPITLDRPLHSETNAQYTNVLTPQQVYRMDSVLAVMDAYCLTGVNFNKVLNIHLFYVGDSNRYTEQLSVFRRAEYPYPLSNLPDFYIIVDTLDGCVFVTKKY